ncbi:hypothetical protein GCM10010918_32840 [Paenibacillus radicis (ex Gao et al. 2016)]|uniref:Uncharacterized protein n=1 Tax=Paenibacillus radicis (ex Gao et al. 2016) TaxID=1737354 RepID=A0A917HCI6_9BACL|nr:hypothetical protein GCM10010918_32840 [Paenibacillus radicis (ex Gao et al. 2016)]
MLTDPPKIPNDALLDALIEKYCATALDVADSGGTDAAGFVYLLVPRVK